MNDAGGVKAPPPKPILPRFFPFVKGWKPSKARPRQVLPKKTKNSVTFSRTCGILQVWEGDKPRPSLRRKELTYMKFTFTDKKVNIPNRVHAYAEKKIGKLERYFRSEPEANVVFSVEKGRNNLEVTLRSGSTIIRVAESTSDMFVSIDAAVASIERQLRKNKSRLEKRLRKEAFEAPAEEYFVPEADADEESGYQVVRSKKFFFRPMTVDEAILQMNLVDHTFFAFRNEDEGGAFSVVYKRNDGGYGIIVDHD